MRLIQPAVEGFQMEKTDSNKDTYTEKFVGAEPNETALKLIMWITKLWSTLWELTVASDTIWLQKCHLDFYIKDSN